MNQEPTRQESVDGTRAYFAQIGNLPRLTPEEEAHYARIYKQARARLVAELRHFPRVVAEVLGQISRIQRMADLAEYIHVREFEDLAALKEQLQVSAHQARDACDELADEEPPFATQPDSHCAREIGRLLTDLPLRDAFCERCVALIARRASSADDTRTPVRRRLAETLAEQHRARTAMVEGNLRLVVSIARKYLNCGLPLMDLIQEGNIGLIRAVENFDVDRGHRFSTYASYWIRRAVTKALTEQSRIIRLPADMVAMLRQISKVREDHLQERGEEPSLEEVAGQVGMPVARVRALTKMSQQMISLQGPPQDTGDERTLIERLCDHNAESPQKRMADSTLKEALARAIDTLNQRERRILTLHYGLDGREAWTLDQIAAEYRLTGERIRQIEHAALRKLREPSRRRILDSPMV